MNEIEDLLELSKDLILKGLTILKNFSASDKEQFILSKKIPNEIKSNVDISLDKFIVNELIKTKISILSEESGYIEGSKHKNLKFIVDPLDGTVNFLRNLGSCSISIALFDRGNPVFGVIATYPEQDLFWGGKDFFSFKNNKKIKVSSFKNKSIICSGIPSRFLKNKKNWLEYEYVFEKFLKVRMLGAASISLLKVAMGSAEMYFEKNIMIWDVAAGLAIVEGSGGNISFVSTKTQNCFDVKATNGLIKDE